MNEMNFSLITWMVYLKERFLTRWGRWMTLSYFGHFVILTKGSSILMFRKGHYANW